MGRIIKVTGSFRKNWLLGTGFVLKRTDEEKFSDILANRQVVRLTVETID